MGNVKMLNVLLKDFNMAQKVNCLSMTLSHQTVACFSHCDFIKFWAHSNSTTVRIFITFRAKIYCTQDFYYIQGQTFTVEPRLTWVIRPPRNYGPFFWTARQNDHTLLIPCYYGLFSWPIADRISWVPLYYTQDLYNIWGQNFITLRTLYLSTMG